MLDARVQIPLDALGDCTQRLKLTNWLSSAVNRMNRVRFPITPLPESMGVITMAFATCAVFRLFRCSSNGKSVCLKSRRLLAQSQPPELATCPTRAAYQ